MKKLILTGMVLGLVTGVCVAQHGRAPGAISPTARPDVNLGIARSAGVSPTTAPSRTTLNRGVSPTAGPIRDPLAGRSTTIAPNAATVNRNVDATAGPIRDPLVGTLPNAAGKPTAANRNVEPTAAPPVRDPK